MSAADDIADSVEYYMDEITDNFEQFIGKTLILVSVALCSVVLMAFYGINQLAGRSRCVRGRETGTGGDIAFQRQSAGNQNSSTACNRMTIKPCTDTSTCTSNATCPSSTAYKEKILKDVVFGTCSKPCNTSETSLKPKPSFSRRVTVTSSGTSANLSICSCKKTPSKKISTSKCKNSRSSCCSLCCTKEEGTQEKTNISEEKT